MPVFEDTARATNRPALVDQPPTIASAARGLIPTATAIARAGYNAYRSIQGKDLEGAERAAREAFDRARSFQQNLLDQARSSLGVGPDDNGDLAADGDNVVSTGWVDP